MECVFQVKIIVSAFQLYQNQKEMCVRLAMKTSAKKAEIEYIQRIRFLIGMQVNFASIDQDT